MGISDFKDFGYNPLHTNKDSIPPKWRHAPMDPFTRIFRYKAYSDNERFDALNPIYKEVVGKDIDKSSIVHLFNRDNHRYDPTAGRRLIGVVENTPDKIAFVDVNVDRHMVDHMNETLAKDNPLREKIDVNGDGILSHNEISDYFDKFAVKGYSIPHYNNDPAEPSFSPSFSSSQSEDTGKISHFDMENIYALQNNAIIQDALFTKYNGDGSFNTNAQLSYDDIKDKSIISESDFRKLDAVSHDCSEKGFIDKGVFDQFEFDKNGDHVIDKDEYAEGMQRVDEYLKEKADALNSVLGNKECNNECATTNLPKQECPEVS